MSRNPFKGTRSPSTRLNDTVNQLSDGEFEDVVGILSVSRKKRAESGKPAELRDTPRETLAKKLRKLDHAPLDAVASDGAEFTLLVARRLPTGEVVLLGEVADDVLLLEKAAKKLLG